MESLINKKNCLLYVNENKNKKKKIKSNPVISNLKEVNKVLDTI